MTFDMISLLFKTQGVALKWMNEQDDEILKDWNKLKGAFIKRSPVVTRKRKMKDALSALYTLNKLLRGSKGNIRQPLSWSSPEYPHLSHIRTTTLYAVVLHDKTIKNICYVNDLFLIKYTRATSIRAQNETKLCTAKLVLIYPTLLTQLGDDAATNSDRKNQASIIFKLKRSSDPYLICKRATIHEEITREEFIRRQWARSE